MEKKKTNPDNKQAGKGLFGKQKPFFKGKGKSADGSKTAGKLAGGTKTAAGMQTGSGKAAGKSAGGTKPSAKSAGGGKAAGKSAGGMKPAAKAAASPKVPAEWLYMTPQEVAVRNLLEALNPADFPDIEIWEGAGVLEIPLGEKSNLDIETVDPPVLEDDFSNAYLKENDIKSLFMVTIHPENFEEAQKAMRQIISVCGGFFCGDTEDFMPLVK